MSEVTLREALERLDVRDVLRRQSRAIHKDEIKAARADRIARADIFAVIAVGEEAAVEKCDLWGAGCFAGMDAVLAQLYGMLDICQLEARDA